MSLGLSTAASRKAALETLKFKKQSKQQAASSGPASSSSLPPWNVQQQSSSIPPLQSRDGTVTSHYFPAPPASPGKVLVPNSSSPPSDSSHRGVLSLFDEDLSGAIPGLSSTDPWSHSATPSVIDSLSTASGFTTSNGGTDASATRPWAGGSYGSSVSSFEHTRDGEPPRKRINRGDSPSDPSDLFAMPGSPEIQRPGHRRRPGASVVSEAASSDESFSEVSKDIAGPSKPRIVRGHHTEASATPQSEEDPRFTRFKITQPFHTADAVRAAWDQSGQDVRKATALLDDPTWKPPVSSPVVTPKTAQQRFETGRVRELEEATKAQKARVRQLGKQSLIYAKQNPAATPPVSKAPLVSIRAHSPATTSPATITPAAPPSPTSPEVTQPRTKRLKRKVVESDSEPDYVESDEDNSRGKSSEEDTHELEALEYFNSAAPEALQELTGCSMEQASKIIEFRPFSSVSDLNTRLGQGRKKAGPAGISSRMFEDCTSIFEGYGTVDNILAKCETIGSRLKAEIATWTGGATREGKQKEKVSSIPGTPDLGEDGALSLRSQAALALRKPDYYISAQPASLSPDLQLKEYQMLGINWLNLLYKEKYSCILADEMGLGKTVQVISFLAHLKDQGSKGPHLVVVPSSTLENWLREFQRFAPDISVRAYYADKNNRGLLRQELLDTRREVDPNGWEILVTTYNLAQGDDRDRKFFRRMHWEACVFDEGHVLKNFQSQRYQALLKFDSKWRLLLTGTPLQNNLQELVSLMNFILPAQFARNMEALRAVFKAKGDSKVTLLAQQRVSRAKKMMTPFVLRRRKDQVLQDLPKKTERIEWCEMTPMQKSIYNDALQRSRKTIFDMEGDVTDPPPPTNGKAKPAKKKTRANARVKDKLYVENSSNVLMDLRKAAAHPMLFRRRFTDDALCSIAKLLLKEPDFKKRGALFELVKEDMEVMTDSELQAFCATYKSTRKFLQSEDCYVQAGKVKVLLKLLTNYQSQGRRVLIFSQFTQILDILQRVLNKENVKFLVLTGSTPVDIRQTLVDEFTEDESIQVFLLSTKAGGMGINLTAASVVIMFDQDFNPHNDKQAQDRAYRIGQKRDVEVIKLITKGSIEEDILELGRTKLALDEAVAGEDGAEDKVEREMKTSLMNVVRKKLQEGNEVAVDEDSKMDVDET